MKKNLLVAVCVMAMLSVLCLTGCAKEETADTKTETTKAAETTAAATDTTGDVSSAEKVTPPESYGTVTLGEYKNLEVTKEDTTITDEAVDAQIESELSAAAEQVEVDRAAQNGDVCNIDYVGTKDGVAFDGGTASGYDLTLGSGTFIPGFEDGLIGAKKGEVRDLNLTFPEAYQAADLAGQDVVFKVTVNSVSEMKTPELTDAWVKEYTGGEQNTVDEYKAAVREAMEKNAEDAAVQAAQQTLTSMAVSNSTFELNQEAVDFQFNELWNMYDQYAQMYGTTIEDYFGMYGMTVEEAKTELTTYAEEICKSKILVDAIFEKENLTLTPEEEEAVAATYGGDAATLKADYGEQEFELVCKQSKVNQFLYDNAKIK